MVTLLAYSTCREGQRLHHPALEPAAAQCLDSCLMCSSADVAKLPCEECRWQWESVVVLVSRMPFRIKNTNQNTDYNGKPW